MGPGISKIKQILISRGIFQIRKTSTMKLKVFIIDKTKINRKYQMMEIKQKILINLIKINNKYAKKGVKVSEIAVL